MTSSLQYIEPDQPLGAALLRMHEKRFRHLPVVKDGKLLGIVSARSAMDPALEEYLVEEKRRRQVKAHSSPSSS